MTGGNYTCDKPSITYRDIKLLCCTTESNTILCINYAKNLKRRKRMWYSKRKRVQTNI